MTSLKNYHIINIAIMKSIIYYFSGTGNSLAIARGIAEKLGETRKTQSIP